MVGTGINEVDSRSRVQQPDFRDGNRNRPRPDRSCLANALRLFHQRRRTETALSRHEFQLRAGGRRFSSTSSNVQRVMSAFHVDNRAGRSAGARHRHEDYQLATMASPYDYF